VGQNIEVKNTVGLRLEDQDRCNIKGNQVLEDSWQGPGKDQTRYESSICSLSCICKKL